MADDLSTLARKIDSQGATSQQAVKGVQRDATAQAAAAQTQVVTSNSRLVSAIDRLAAEIIRQKEGNGDDAILQQLKLLTETVKSLKEQQASQASQAAQTSGFGGGASSLLGFSLPSPNARGMMGGAKSILDSPSGPFGKAFEYNTGIPNPISPQGRDALRSDSNQALGGTSQMWGDYLQAIAQLKALGPEMTQLGRAMGFMGDQATAAFQQIQKIGTGYGESATQVAQHTQAIQQGRMLFGSPDSISKQTQSAYTSALSMARHTGTSVDQQIPIASQRSMLNVNPEEFADTMSVAMARAGVTGQATVEMQQMLNQLLQTQAGSSIAQQGTAAIQGSAFLSNLYGQNAGNPLGITEAAGVLNQFGQQAHTQGTQPNAYLESIQAQKHPKMSQYDVKRSVQEMTPEEGLLMAANSMFPGQDPGNLSPDDEARLMEQMQWSTDNYQAGHLALKGLSGMTPEILQQRGKQITDLKTRFGPGAASDTLIPNLVNGMPGSEQMLEASIGQQKGGADFLSQHPNTKGADLLSQYADTNKNYNPNTDKTLLSGGEQLANATATKQEKAMTDATSLYPTLITNQQNETKAFSDFSTVLNKTLEAGNQLLTPLNNIASGLGLVSGGLGAVATAQAACCGGGASKVVPPFRPKGGGDAPKDASGAPKTTVDPKTGKTVKADAAGKPEIDPETGNPIEITAENPGGRTLAEIGANKTKPPNALTVNDIEAMANGDKSLMGRVGRGMSKVSDVGSRAIDGADKRLTNFFGGGKRLVNDLYDESGNLIRSAGDAAPRGSLLDTLSNLTTQGVASWGRGFVMDTLDANAGDVAVLGGGTAVVGGTAIAATAAFGYPTGKVLQASYGDLLTATHDLPAMMAHGYIPTAQELAAWKQQNGGKDPTETPAYKSAKQVYDSNQAGNQGDAEKRYWQYEQMQTGRHQWTPGGTYPQGYDPQSNPAPTPAGAMPGYASGGPVTRRMNERGPEAVNLMPGDQVTPFSALVNLAQSDPSKQPATEKSMQQLISLMQHSPLGRGSLSGASMYSVAEAGASVPGVALPTAYLANGLPDYGYGNQNVMPSAGYATDSAAPAPVLSPTALSPGPAGQGGAFNQFAALSIDDYYRVIDSFSAGGRPSPLRNPGSYQALMQTAKARNINPRTLLSVMAPESHFGTDKGDKLWAHHNYFGMGVSNRPGVMDSGVHATDGGPEYAGYADDGTAFNDLASWITQKPAYAAGNMQAVFSDYQSADQGQGKASIYDRIGALAPALDQPTGSVAAAAGTPGPLAVALPPEVVNYLKAIADSTQTSLGHLQQIASQTGVLPGGGYARANPQGGSDQISTVAGARYASSPALPPITPYDGVFVTPRGRPS